MQAIPESKENGKQLDCDVEDREQHTAHSSPRKGATVLVPQPSSNPDDPLVSSRCDMFKPSPAAQDRGVANFEGSRVTSSIHAELEHKPKSPPSTCPLPGRICGQCGCRSWPARVSRSSICLPHHSFGVFLFGTYRDIGDSVWASITTP